MPILRRLWTRPSLMIFTENAPIEDSPGSASAGLWSLGNADTDFLYLTDDSRSQLQISLERIEYKKRMINGRMRAYHVADKKTFSVGWQDLPSQRSEISEQKRTKINTGWASSQQMLSWYESHTDSFYLTLVYDTPLSDLPSSTPLKYNLETYNVFFDDFSYIIKKRGPTHDLWDVSMTLVEV